MTHRIAISESSVIRTLAYAKRNMCNVLGLGYGLCSYDGDAIKYAVFEHFPLLFVTRDSDAIL